jgi:hypothetical protein
LLICGSARQAQESHDDPEWKQSIPRMNSNQKGAEDKHDKRDRNVPSGFVASPAAQVCRAHIIEKWDERDDE